MRFLNIEVALAIVALAHLASKAMGVTLTWSWYVVVPTATWALYTLDRIYDVRNKVGYIEAGRHAFHRKHRKVLGITSAVILIAGVELAAIEFPYTYWLAAAVLAAFLVLHILLQSSTSVGAAIAKDVNVAVTFTAAAWCIPAIIRLHELRPNEVSLHIHSILHACLVFVALLSLVTADVLLLSKLDAHTDSIAKQPSIAVALGDKSGWMLTALLMLTSCLSIVIWWASGESGIVLYGGIRPAIVLLAMAGAYALLSVRRPENPDTARLVYEGVLLLGFLA